MVETRWTYWYWHASNWWEGPPLPFLNYYFQVYRFRRSCLWIFFSLHTHVSINVNRLNTFKHILKEGSIHELSVFHVRGSGDLLTLTAAEATGRSRNQKQTRWRSLLHQKQRYYQKKNDYNWNRIAEEDQYFWKKNVLSHGTNHFPWTCGNNCTDPNLEL